MKRIKTTSDSYFVSIMKIRDEGRLEGYRQRLKKMPKRELALFVDFLVHQGAIAEEVLEFYFAPSFFI